ncbi:MAG: hypothetical protein IJ863_00260 [Spirochaetales bacterium]|nr:hypothetical protein [Spirochaetales bacterium]
MKRVLTILVVITTLFCLTSCSDGLSGLMGKMGNNIYGIKPDVRKANDTASKVEATKQQDGTVSIDYTGVASIVDSIQDLKASDSNIATLKGLLSEPVFRNQADIDALKTSLSDKSDAIADGIGEDATGVKKTIRDAAQAYAASLGDVPVKSDLAILAVIDRMAKSADELEGADLVDEGLKCVDALKLLTNVGEVDALGDSDIKNLIELFQKPKSSSTSRAFSGENFTKTFDKSLKKIVKLVTNDDKTFDVNVYRDIVLESFAIKAAYDMVTQDYEIDFLSLLMGLGSEGEAGTLGLKLEDLGTYLICSTMVTMAEIDNCLQEHDEIVYDPWENFVEGYVESNYDAFMGNAEFKAPDGDSFAGFMDYFAQLLKAAMPTLGFMFEYDKDADYETKSEQLSEGVQMLIFEISMYFIDQAEGEDEFGGFGGGLEAYMASLAEGDIVDTVKDLIKNLQYDLGSEIKTLYTIIEDSGYSSLLNGPMKKLQEIVEMIMNAVMDDDLGDLDFDDLVGDEDSDKSSDPLPLDFKEEGENFLLGYGAVSEGFDMEGFRVAFTAAEDEDTVVPVEIGGKENVYWYGYDSDYTFYTMKGDSLMVYSEEGWEKYADESVQSIRAALFNPFVESVLYGIYEEGFAVFDRDESSDETVCGRPCLAYWIDGREDIDVILVDENYGFLAKTVSLVADKLYMGYTLTSVEIDSTTLPEGYEAAAVAIE